MKTGLNDTRDYLALLVRRKWWIIFTFVALFSAMAVLTSVLPKTFVSESLILVQPRDVPTDMVRDLISGSPEDRLKSIQQTMLSRTNLVQILREFGDKMPDLSRMNMDGKVQKLRGQISIVFQLDKAGYGKTAPLTNFRISYQNADPELAQKIASRLTALFIEQDSKTRETQVFGTIEFLTAEWEKVSQQLKEAEESLQTIKAGRQFELPTQLEPNLRALDRLGGDKKSNVEALDRQLTIRLNLETQLSQTPQFLPKASILRASLARPDTRTVQSDEQRRALADYDEYRKAQTEFDDLASKYTEKHPEVQMARARMERLKQRVPPETLNPSPSDSDATATTEAAPAADAMEPNPLYQKLVGQLEELKTEIAIRERDKTWIEGEIAKYSRRVENTPSAEQDIAGASRHYDDLKKQYDELKSKVSQVRLSESLESRQKGSQFLVQDPANYPLVPAKPNKSLVLLGSAFISLFLSLVFGAVVDVTRQKIWTHSQIEAICGAPVLVEIPEIVTDADLVAVKKKRVMFAAYSAAVAAAYGLCLYGLYLRHSFILRQLDPIIQKLVYK